MKKLLVVLLGSLFLAACGDVYESDTPEMAIQNLQKDFVEEMQEIQLYEVNEKEQIAVFKATINDGVEYFVAMVDLVEGGKWRVMEAVAIGKVHDTFEKTKVGGTSFEAGFMDRITDAAEPQFTDNEYIFNLAETDKAMWVKIK